MKKVIKLSASMILLFGIVSLAMAGWGGRFRCLSCKFESEELHIGEGTETSYAVIYCNKCKDFYSILVEFDEERIRGGRLHPEKEIEELKTNIVRPVSEVYVYELGKIIKIYPCPKCGQVDSEVDKKIITDVVARRTKEGKIEIGKCLLCPRCEKETLYFDHTFKWD